MEIGLVNQTPVDTIITLTFFPSFDILNRTPPDRS